MSTPDRMTFNYKVRFSKDRGYRLQGWNSPWPQNNDREIEDLRVMFDGRDLENNDLAAYKVVKWEELEPGRYDVEVKMTLYKTYDAKYEQLFELIELKKV